MDNEGNSSSIIKTSALCVLGILSARKVETSQQGEESKSIQRSRIDMRYESRRARAALTMLGEIPRWSSKRRDEQHHAEQRAGLGKTEGRKERNNYRHRSNDVKQTNPPRKSPLAKRNGTSLFATYSDTDAQTRSSASILDTIKVLPRKTRTFHIPNPPIPIQTTDPASQSLGIRQGRANQPGEALASSRLRGKDCHAVPKTGL